MEIAEHHRTTRREVLDYLRVEHGISNPSRKLQSLFDLDLEGFLAEIKRLRGARKPLGLHDHRILRETFSEAIHPTKALIVEGKELERMVDQLVIESYKLTPEEVRLMWETAPPRMPLAEREGPVEVSGSEVGGAS